MTGRIRIGLIGCGVVGQGVLKVLHDNSGSIGGRLGGRIEVRRVAVRNVGKARGIPIDSALLTTSPNDVLSDPEIDVVVELMGGVDPAGAYVRAAIEAGKSVVTANKALLAEHAHELIELAEARGVDLYFEAAVAGGVPVIRVLREALASDRVVALRGIVNGTSNYILSRMREARIGFQEALVQAQKAGYAEADPTLDISGGDAAHKLTILATLAFGAKVSPAQVSTEGISDVEAIDMEFAERFGYVIKPLAAARLTKGGELELRVHPALVGRRNVLASISDALNAVQIESVMLGPCVLSGYGAGALPTAVSVVSDIIDVGRNLLTGARGRVPQRAFHGDSLVAYDILDPGERAGRYYLRFSVLDRPGVLARIAGILGAFDVSIEQMVQEGRAENPDAPVTMVMVTHRAVDRNVRSALREIQALSHVVQPSRALRIEDT